MKVLIFIKNLVNFFIYNAFRMLLNTNADAENNKYLIVNTGQIGDLLIGSVLFANSNNLPKKYEIHYLIKSDYEEIFNDYKGHIKIITWEQNKYRYNLIYRYRFLRKLINNNYSHSVNVTTGRGPVNDELCLLSGAKTKIRINSNYYYLQNIFGKYYNRKYDTEMYTAITHELTKQKMLYEDLFKTDIEKRTKIFIDKKTIDDTVDKVENIYGINCFNNIITICPLSDRTLKNWSIDNYNSLINKILSDTSLSIVLLGSLQQRRTLEKLRSISAKRIYNFSGLFNLLESSVILSESKLFIGNDSGFTHISVALGKNTIGVIGGGSIGTFFPYDKTKNLIMINKTIECFGCDWHCIKKYQHCISEVTVKDVYDRINELLGVEQE